jgi:peptide/nickel transport system substrate-binding protein
MDVLTRRNALQLIGASSLFALPSRFAFAAGDTRPSITIAVQKIATSNTLEPLREVSNVGQRTFSLFLESLLDLDWTGDMTIKPRLAESGRRIDFQTLELKLRDNVRLHNGDLLTAEDVAFSFGKDRMWSGAPLAPGAYVNNNAGLSTKTPPMEVPQIAKGSFPGFDRIEIVDKNTIRFINNTPDLALEGRLTRFTAAIISQRAFQEAPNWIEWSRKTIGTGPYKIAAYKPDNSLVLEAHDEYWGGRPPIKQIKLVEIPEISSRVNGLLAGDFDYACDLPPDQIPNVEKSAKHHVLGGKITNVRMTSFDKGHPVLKDPRVRLAMAWSVDRQSIVNSLWSGRTGVPNGMQLEFFGDMYLKDWQSPSFDPAKAKALLKEANYQGEPIPYQLLNNYYTAQVPTAQILVEGWRSVGINVEIEMKENWSQVLEPTPRRGICDGSVSAWFPDPSASTAAFAPGAQNWMTNQWQNEEAAAAVKELQSGTDLAKRRAAFRRVLEVTEVQDPGYIVLHQNGTFTGTRRDFAWKPAGSFVMDFRASNFSAG